MPNHSDRNVSDLLIHAGRHFVRVSRTFCNLKALITNGLIQMGVEEPDPLEDIRYIMHDVHINEICSSMLFYFASKLREQSVFKELLEIGGLEERLLASSDDEVELIADLVSSEMLPVIWNVARSMSMQIEKGMNGARGDDTKSMKVAIINWITPPGQNLTPPLNRKLKSTRSFHHQSTGVMLCPSRMYRKVPE